MKRIWKIVLVLLGTILLLLAVAPTVIGFVSPKIIARMNEGIAGKLEVKSVKLGWFHGAELRDVVLKDPAGSEVFSAKSIRLDDSLISTLLSPRNFGHLIIDEPHIVICETPSGITLEKSFAPKIPEKQKGKNKKSSTPLFFTHCTIHNGTFCFSRPDCEAICVSDFSATIAITNLRRLDADIKAIIQKGSDTGSFELVASGDNVREIASTYKALIRGGASNETSDDPAQFRLRCTINALPMTVLDAFSGLCLEGERQFFSSAVGESLTMTLDHSLDDNKMSLQSTVESKNLHAKIDLGFHDNILEMKECFVKGTLTPKLFRAYTMNMREVHGYELFNEAAFHLTAAPTSIRVDNKEPDKTPLSIQFAFDEPLLMRNMSYKRDFTLLPEGKIEAMSLRDAVHFDATAKIQYGSKEALVHGVIDIKDPFGPGMKANAEISSDGASAALIPFIATGPEYITGFLGREFHSKQTFEFPELAKSFAFRAEMLLSSDTVKVQNSATFDGNTIKVVPLILLGEFSPDQVKAIAPRLQLLSPLRLKMEAHELEFDTSHNHEPIASALSFDVDPFEIIVRPQDGPIVVKKVSITEKRERSSPQQSIGASILINFEKASPALQALFGNELDASLNASGTTKELRAYKPTFYSAKLSSPTLKGEASSSHAPEVELLVKKEAGALFKDLLPMTLTHDLHCHVVLTSPLPLQTEVAATVSLDDLHMAYNGVAFDGYSLTAPCVYNLKTRGVSGTLDCTSKTDAPGSLNISGSFALAPVKKELPYLITTGGHASNIPVTLVAACLKKADLGTLLGPMLSLDWNVSFNDPKNRDKMDINLSGKDLSLKAAMMQQNGKLQASAPCEISLLVTPERIRALSKMMNTSEWSNQYTLQKECPVRISVSKFEMPYKVLFEPKPFLPGCMSFAATIESGAAIFSSKKGEGTYGFCPLSATCELTSSKTFQLSAQSKKEGDEHLARLAVNVHGHNLFDEKGMTFDRAEIEIDGTLQEVPLALLEPLEGTATTLAALLGDTVNIRLNGKMKTLNEGSYTAKIESERCHVECATNIKNGSLYLSKPVRGTLDVTKKSGKALLKGAAPKVVTGFYADHPIEFYIDNTGFQIPLRGFSMNKIQVSAARVELGKIMVKKGDSLEVLSDLLGLHSGKEMNLWFTPLYYSVQNGVIICQRVDVLIDDRAHLCAWGSIDLPHDYMQMRLGIFGTSLRKVIPSRHLDENYVLQLPLQGPIGSAKIDKKYATAKIASLSLSDSKNATGALIGGLLGVAAQAGEPDVPVPERTTSPFPWEERGR